MRSAVAFLRDLAASLRIWFINPACPWCADRPSNLEVHFRIAHAGDQMRRPR